MKKLFKLFLKYSILIFLIGAIDFILFEINLNTLDWIEIKLAICINLLIFIILYISFTVLAKKSLKEEK
tara:strand:+ start:1318 stop:1524 length:207 start_codon:yes stop_codon:yes gene_type:complete